MRVDVHVHAARVDLQEQKRRRMPSFEQLVRKRLFQRVFHHLALHPSSVDEEHLHPLVVARIGGRRNEACEAAFAVRSRLSFDGHQTLGHLRAIEGQNRRSQVPFAQSGVKDRPVGNEAETDVWIGQRHFRHVIADQAGFGVVRLQEFASGRRVIEQVRHDDGRSVLAGRFRDLFADAAFDADPGACRLVCRFRDQFRAGHRRDARQRFSPETQGADGVQVVFRRDLARSVAHKGQFHFAGRNAASVVRDPDIILAAFADLAGDRRSACVQRVLDQFLDDGDRPLDDFASGDLIR